MKHFPILLVLLAAAPAPAAPAPSSSDLGIVDCLLPGQVRRLGTQQTYVSRRRPARLPASECEIRGGEYVAWDRADAGTALKVWLESATAGDPQAQLRVGEIHEKGLGIPPDPASAATWYRKAAEQGSSAAMIALGHLYETGAGVPRDPSEAVRWYRRASGLPEAIALEPSAPPPDGREAARAAEQEVAALRARLRELEAELGAAREAVSKTAGEAASREAAIGELERLLQERESKLVELERAREQEEAARRDREAAAAVAPPSIEVIDPPVKRTRGIEVVAAEAEERTVVGRVDAPAGLMTFLVNDRDVPVDERGLFRSAVPVTPPRTAVSLVAVDRLGKRATFEFELATSAPPAPRSPVEKLRLGGFHALIIANAQYPDLPDLETPAADAAALARLLESRYGFRTRVLRDATRYQILSALNDLRRDVAEDDSVLVYYAGHGEFDAAIPRGYWLPVDAERENPANWLSTSTISDYLGVLPARHVLVVADSCYAGALTRSALARLDEGATPEARAHWLRTVAEKRSRTALTSGGLQPVLDAGGGGHSVFAKALLSVLEGNDGILESRKLHLEVAARVAWAAASEGTRQEPEYAPLKFAGHEGGDFLFVPRR
jgi:uncharacterized caspase-like protein